MKKERETANKYRQQALEGDLMAMNNMGVCYAQGIGVVEDHVMAFQWYMKAAELGPTSWIHTMPDLLLPQDHSSNDPPDRKMLFPH